MIQLSICIPTYNRAEYLRKCLDSLTSQVKGRHNVEIIICDNNSPDSTMAVAQEFRKVCKNIRYFKNNENLGYAGNQVECFRRASGKYMAVLCDDDIYLKGAVDRILEVANQREYVLIVLNYYGFLRDKNKVFKTDFAPVKDVVFDRAYDIMNYPSVGHFSGFIFNLPLAVNALNAILSRKSFYEFEKNRGIINETACRSALASSLPAYFVGSRLLAVHSPDKVDYDSLWHRCIYYYEQYLALYNEGLIGGNDLAYRKKLVLSRLPRAIVSNSPELDVSRLNEISSRLNSFFGGEKKFRIICRLLLIAGRWPAFRLIFRFQKKIVRAVRKLWRRINR